jgi:hypothetical protein
MFFSSLCKRQQEVLVIIFAIAIILALVLLDVQMTSGVFLG